MGKKSKHMFRLYSKSKEVDSGSSSSSSESDSDSISDSDRKNLNRHKKSVRSGKIMMKSRRSSSSSDDRKKREEQEHFRKLEAKRNHLKRKLKEAKLKKRRSEASSSIKSRSHRTSSSEYQSKLEKYAEYNSIRSRNKEVSDIGKQVRSRECEHRFGSRSPKTHRSHQLNTRETIIIQTSNKDGTPSSRHEKRMRHYDDFKDDLQICEIERKSVSSKDRTGAMAHCQERLHARRRNMKEKKSYNEKDTYSGMSNREESRSDRILLQTSDRDIGPMSGYREDAANIGDHIQNKNKCLDMFINKEMYNSGEHFGGREELRRDQKHLCMNQRDLKSTREHYAPRICDPIRLCDEERDRMFSSHNFESSPNERSVLINTREIHERKKHDMIDSYKLSHFHEVEHNPNYHNEREFFLRDNGRESMEFNEVEGLRWNNHWGGQPLHEEDLNNAVPSCSGFIGGPKFHTNEQKNSLPNPKILPCEQHNFQKSKWNMEEFQHTVNVESKIDKSPKYWENRIFDNMKDERDIQPDKHWTPDWHNNNEIIKRDKSIKLIHARSDRYGHGYRRNPMEIEKRNAQLSGFKYHPPSLMNINVQPPGGYRAGNSRFPVKRNMTYTNPNLTTSTQSNIVVAATTAIAAAKAAAQSVANDMNPSILSHTNINSGRQQQPRKTTTTIVEKTVVTGFEEINKETCGIAKTDANMQKTTLIDKNELINGALSEISDSDDEILNNSQKKTTVNIECKINEIEINEFDFSMQNKSVDNFDKVVDFEEISDGELEEDIRYKGLGDAVGVDWASLIAETKRQPKVINNETNIATNGIQKWQACKIISDMGISKRMVDEKYAKHILSTIKENAMDTDNLKNEPEKLIFNYSLLYDKSQIIPNDSEELFWFDCVTIVKDEKNLFNNCALNSRKDLRLRRELCNLSVHEKDASQILTFGKLNKSLILDTFQLAVNAN